MVFRDLGTSCTVHIFAEASVQLRMGCGLRTLNRSGGSEVDCSVLSEADEKWNWLKSLFSDDWPILAVLAMKMSQINPILSGFPGREPPLLSLSTAPVIQD
ncbi:uncharacterized protein WM294_006299 isoform 1-T1 [Sarcoramphus papa]